MNELKVLDNLYENYEELEDVKNFVVGMITCQMNYSGIMYRAFSRVKTRDSFTKKYQNKKSKYEIEKRGVQDLLGIRLVLYFKEDIDICINILNNIFKEVSHEYDSPDSTTFKPIRINYVYELPDEKKIFSKLIKGEENLLDDTFEVQIRTVLSEGWHEVEHDIKYKKKADWENENEMARDFNAILAALEICDNNILGICDNLAYNKYKSNKISSMVRFRFRLRFQEKEVSDKIEKIIFKKYDVIAKKIFRYDKQRLVDLFLKTKVDITLDNAILLINMDNIHDEELIHITDSEIYTRYNSVIKSVMDESGENKPYKSIVAMKF